MGRDPGTGKQVQRSVYGKTQKEVREKLTQAAAALNKGIYQPPNKITIAEWMEEWLTTFCAGKVKPLSYQSYAGIIKNYIVPAIGAVELQAVRGTHIQRLYNSMTKKGLSGKTVKNVGEILHKAFSVALKQRIMAANPATRRSCLKCSAKRFTCSQMMRFLCSSPPLTTCPCATPLPCVCSLG